VSKGCSSSTSLFRFRRSSPSLHSPPSLPLPPTSAPTLTSYDLRRGLGCSLSTRSRESPMRKLRRGSAVFRRGELVFLFLPSSLRPSQILTPFSSLLHRPSMHMGTLLVSSSRGRRCCSSFCPWNQVFTMERTTGRRRLRRTTLRRRSVPLLCTNVSDPQIVSIPIDRPFQFIAYLRHLCVLPLRKLSNACSPSSIASLSTSKASSSPSHPVQLLKDPHLTIYTSPRHAFSSFSSQGTSPPSSLPNS